MSGQAPPNVGINVGIKHPQSTWLGVEFWSCSILTARERDGKRGEGRETERERETEKERKREGERERERERQSAHHAKRHDPQLRE